MDHVAFMLALSAAAVFGVADFLGGLATKRSPVIPVMVLSRMIGAAVILATLTVSPATFQWAAVFWGALAGLAGGIGLALLYRGLAVGTMSAVAPITAVCGAAVPAMVGMALGERPSALALAGVGLAFVAIVLMMYPSPPAHEKRGPHPAGVTRELAYALAAGAAIGGFFVFLSLADPAAGVWPLVASQTSALALFVSLGAATRRLRWPPRNALPPALGAAVGDALGTILLLLALYLGPLGLVAVLTSLYPAATVALAIMVLGERVSPRRIAGFVCAGAATLLIAAG